MIKLQDPKTKSPLSHILFKSIPQSKGHHILKAVRLKNMARIELKNPIPKAKYKLVTRQSHE